jgi:hypothetical protein
MLAAGASAAGLFAHGVYRDNAFVSAGWSGNDLVTGIQRTSSLRWT